MIQKAGIPPIWQVELTLNLLVFVNNRNPLGG
jgi:hypothetical protein